MTPPSRAKIVAWIHSAWGDLSQTIIINGFKKTKLVFTTETTDEEPAQDFEDLELMDRLEALNLVEELTQPDAFDLL